MTVLSSLFTQLHIPCFDNREILGISDDSRQIEKDWIFVCRKGITHHGIEFIEDVLLKGAVVLCDQDVRRKDVYRCENIEHILQAILELYYGDLCKDICVIGITGTSGKSSVASILSQILRLKKESVLQIGTHEVFFPEHTEAILNTTPDMFQLATYFSTARNQSIKYIVMEVSSHAIDQNRICFIRFDIIVYTNISQDHLDYHLTKTQYRYTKFKLRRYLKNDGVIVVNGDFPNMNELVDLAQHRCISIGCGQSHFHIEGLLLSEKDTSFTLHGYTFHTHLISMANVYNVVEVVAVCRKLGISYENLQELMEQVQPIKGRMEIVQERGITVWIDYAHTPDALAAILQFAQSVKQNHVLCVLGCGGNRDKKKRHLMGEIACKYSDLAIFTADNPRYEEIEDIIFDMCKIPSKNYTIFENRYFALKHTIKIAQNSDIIVVAGKGNELVQEIRGERYPFDDCACVCELLHKEELFWK